MKAASHGAGEGKWERWGDAGAQRCTPGQRVPVCVKQLSWKLMARCPGWLLGPKCWAEGVTRSQLGGRNVAAQSGAGAAGAQERQGMGAGGSSLRPTARGDLGALAALRSHPGMGWEEKCWVSSTQDSPGRAVPCPLTPMGQNKAALFPRGGRPHARCAQLTASAAGLRGEPGPAQLGAITAPLQERGKVTSDPDLCRAGRRGPGD